MPGRPSRQSFVRVFRVRERQYTRVFICAHNPVMVVPPCGLGSVVQVPLAVGLWSVHCPRPKVQGLGHTAPICCGACLAPRAWLLWRCARAQNGDGSVSPSMRTLTKKKNLGQFEVCPAVKINIVTSLRCHIFWVYYPETPGYALCIVTAAGSASILPLAGCRRAEQTGHGANDIHRA
jgi:hypothetical protein